MPRRTSAVARARAAGAAAAVMLLALVASIGTAAAVDYPPRPPQVTVASTVADVGGTLVLGVQFFNPGCDVAVSVNGRLVDQVTADGTGAFKVSLTVPRPGVNFVKFQGCGETKVVRIFGTNVQGVIFGSGGGGQSGGGLARTGADVLRLLLVGAGLIGAGAGITWLTRRRRAQA